MAEIDVDGLVAEARNVDVHDVMHRLNPLTVLKLLSRLADALASEKVARVRAEEELLALIEHLAGADI